MFRNKSIALVIPAYNEEKLIKPTLEAIPSIIDKVYVVDDVSPDNQCEVIENCAKNDPRITLIKHKENQGPGGAIITGYKAAAADNFDLTVVIGGDNQMPLDEVENLLNPLIDGNYDYAKGNRWLLSQVEDTLSKMPKLRIFGNWLITALTKIASGYYKTMDVVDGYTAITKEAIETINWDNAWKEYGYPMDFLIRLNGYGYKLIDVPRTAIYLPGERQSQIKGMSYFFRVSPMLLKGFLWRLHFRYMYVDFHPLVFFYYLGFTLLPLGLVMGGILIFDKTFFSGNIVTASKSIFCGISVIAGLQFILFAMFFDMEEGKN